MLLALLITAGLMSSLVPGTGLNPKAKKLGAELEQYVRNEAAANAEKNATIVAELRSSEGKTPVQLYGELDGKKLTSETEAVIQAEIAIEAKKPVPDLAVNKLQTAKDPDVVKVRSWLLGPASETDLAKARETLKSGSFLEKLAKVEALERSGDQKARATAFASGSAKQGLIAFISVAGGVTLLFFACGAILFLYHEARNQGKFAPKGLANEPANLAEADKLAMRAWQLLAIFIAPEFLPLRHMAPHGYEQVVQLIVPNIVRLVGMAALMYIPVGETRFDWKSYGFARKTGLANLGWGFAGLFGGMPLVVSFGIVFLVVASRVFPTADHPLTQELANHQNLPLVIAAIFTASLTAPLFEETLFRGTILPALSGLFAGQKFRLAISLGISSLIFAACHPTGIPTWGILGGIACLSGLLSHQTKSIIPGIVVHIAWNSLIAALNLMS